MVSPVAALAKLLALLAGLLASAGCAGAQIVVDDDSGHSVRLGAPAQRIVSLAPHLTELLFEAGAEQRIVGADVHSDYPTAARQITRIGDAFSIDMERLLQLRPDLVVAWRSGNARKTLARLRALSIPVFESEPYRLEDIPRTIERLGMLAGTTNEAGARADRFRRRRGELAARYAGKAPLRVFYEVWHRPLMTIGASHLIADALATCGARNVLPGLTSVTAMPAREAVLLADPDAIVVASGDAGTQRSWAQWRHLRAARTHGILHIDSERMHRATSRILDEVGLLCRRLDDLRGRSGGSAILAPGSATVGSMP